ncbi:MAG: hypothetical protein AB8B81_17345 [Halioglobus sp.]
MPKPREQYYGAEHAGKTQWLPSLYFSVSFIGNSYSLKTHRVKIMKAVKIIGGIALVLLVVVAVGGYFLWSNLDNLVKDMIEDVGSDVTRTGVQLDSVQLDLTTGRSQLNGLTINNPQGYESEYALKLDTIVVQIDPTSLREPVIVISQVSIDGAKLIAEQKGKNTNLGQLLKNMERDSGSKKSPPAGESSSQDIRLMLKKFDFLNARATVVSEITETQSIEIPDIRETNIGDTKKGLTPDQLAQTLLGNIVKKVQKSVTRYLRDLGVEAVEKKLTEKLKEKLSADDMSKVEGLKNLFKKDK